MCTSIVYLTCFLASRAVLDNAAIFLRSKTCFSPLYTVYMSVIVCQHDVGTFFEWASLSILADVHIPHLPKLCKICHFVISATTSGRATPLLYMSFLFKVADTPNGLKLNMQQLLNKIASDWVQIIKVTMTRSVVGEPSFTKESNE